MVFTSLDESFCRTFWLESKLIENKRISEWCVNKVRERRSQLRLYVMVQIFLKRYDMRLTKCPQSQYNDFRMASCSFDLVMIQMAE